ncbi:hypothetical protein C0J50_16775 [Silurus asotus]|uniref:Ig-like domain-containing protein n=1 Tax=Silurus asotus TaxID=30991 RepID=A0AAD5AY53_SILAS|nr:hypothetical protein C0J50_16775 [Silurus asotus]
MFTVIFMCLWLSLGDSTADPIEPLSPHKVVDEGENVTLSCSYKKLSGAVNNLQWYRHYPTSKPVLLLYIQESTKFKGDIPPRLDVELDKNNKQVNLIISSAAVSDSALLLCSGAHSDRKSSCTEQLYKNIMFKETTEDDRYFLYHLDIS